ncbi:hypothetical protein B6D60_04985 [candidate division KSB1 bacterium 4484_87]|nr:MAG: hypothetical protein B6D60_04985 [candidate division KSB1 bacterium 4484_87]
MKKFAFLAILLLLLPEFLLAQSVNLNFIGAGARARGMGGAFIGVADDATAASWNPAGLARLEKAEASVVGVYSSYTPSSDVEGFDAEPYKYSHVGLNFGSIAFPLSIGERNLVATVAYQNVIDLYYKYSSDQYETERTGGIYAIMPSVGLQLTPMVSIGAAVNIINGTSDYKQTDRTGFLGDSEESYSYSGMNFSIGALLDFESFRVGATLKTPFGLNESMDDEDYDVDIGMPQMLGIGIAFQATDALLLAADYEMRNYSNSKTTYNKAYGAHRENDEVSLEWEDINQIRVGAEYLLMSGDNILPIRLGFATTPLPYKDQDDKQVVGANFTAGLGLIMGNINLDVGVEYNTYTYEIQNVGGNNNYSDNYLRIIFAGVFHFGQ